MLGPISGAPVSARGEIPRYALSIASLAHAHGLVAAGVSDNYSFPVAVPVLSNARVDNKTGTEVTPMVDVT